MGAVDNRADAHPTGINLAHIVTRFNSSQVPIEDENPCILEAIIIIIIVIKVILCRQCALTVNDNTLTHMHVLAHRDATVCQHGNAVGPWREFFNGILGVETVFAHTLTYVLFCVLTKSCRATHESNPDVLYS